MSVIAHYIAGVLPWEAMAGIVDSLAESTDWKAGDRVKTLRGSLHGIIVKVLEDGRIVWKPDATAGDLIALPESLCRDG
jgi:hypothetical protein